MKNELIKHEQLENKQERNEPKTIHQKINKKKKIISDFVYIMTAYARSMLNSSLNPSFFRGKTHPPIPHAYSKSIAGHLKFRLEQAEQCSLMATGVGALAHSTANTLDWAVATLLKNPKKLEELQQLMVKYKDLDLTDEGLFDKDNGPLFPIAAWILRNVFLYPPFTHEFFLNSRPFPTELPDGTEVTVPRMSLILVNYQSCNRTEKEMATEESFCQSLAPKDTIGKFVMSKWNASFGGSEVSRKNTHSRKCPGAKLSLHEQMVMVATLLRDYDIKVDPSQDILCDSDPDMFPICSRVNVGRILLKKK
jgi:cytochrome P450